MKNFVATFIRIGAAFNANNKEEMCISALTKKAAERKARIIAGQFGFKFESIYAVK
jgi:TRAP-type C4-dicarboxylate transport system permease small subunit